MLRTTTAHALREEGHTLVLSVPTRHYFVRAGTLGLLVPFLLFVLVGLFAALELLEVGELGGLTYVMLAVASVGSAIAVPFALVMAIRAPGLSKKSQVVVDLQERVIHPREGDPIPLDRVAGLSLRKPNAMLKWMSIQADITDAPSEDSSPYRPPAVRSIDLVSRINELEAEAGRVLMADIGRRLNLETTDRTSSLLGGGGADGQAAGRTAHALAYVPVQGIFFFASAFLLIARRGDPRAMFHAMQSMLVLAFEMGVILVVALFGGGLVLASEASGGALPHAVGLVVLGVGLVPFTALRLVGRFYAAWRAWKGDTWLVPVVGRISRRWLPEDG